VLDVDMGQDKLTCSSEQFEDVLPDFQRFVGTVRAA
jgi:hypothetical protein